MRIKREPAPRFAAAWHFFTRVLLSGWLVWTAFYPAPLWAVERFPPPEFESDYVMPHPTTPPPRATTMEYIDTGVFLAALALAAWLVLRVRQRRWIALLTAFSLLYFGFYRKGCICAVGSVQDVALALFQPSYTVPITVVIFFLAPLLFALFFGRVFCGGVCPLGAIQDLVLFKPVKLPAWIRHALSHVPFAYLGLAVLLAATGSAFIICEYDPFVGFFRMSGSFPMLAFGGSLLVLGVFVGRPYCRFLCPYGALLSIFSRVSKWNVTLSPNDCIRCQLCDVACPYDVIYEPAPKDAPQGMPWDKRRVLIFACLVPALAVAGGWIGYHAATPLARHHATVVLAEQIASEDSGVVTETTEASRAFRQTGKPVTDLIQQAARLRGHFQLGSTLLGAFVGFMLGIKLVQLTIPSVRTSYDPDHANCVSCGRCYTACPKETGRQKQLKRERSAPTAAA